MLKPGTFSALLEIMNLKIGDKVVSHNHGISTLQRIENKLIGDKKMAFYVFTTKEKLTIMIPETEVNFQVRPIESKEIASKILRHIKEVRESILDESKSWNRSFRNYDDLLKTGSLSNSGMVFNKLKAVSYGKDLSYGEKKMICKAIKLLSTEMAISLDIPEETLTKDLLYLCRMTKKQL